MQRDALGVVTIDAGSEADAMRALGYVHAQERYFEMDLMRRSAAGELAELFGPRAVPLDRTHRMHRLRARATAQLPAIAGERLPVLRAYTDGVNAGLSSLRARPWPYLLLRQAPRPWQPVDSPMVGYAMYFDLQDGANEREYALWKLRPHAAGAAVRAAGARRQRLGRAGGRRFARRRHPAPGHRAGPAPAAGPAARAGDATAATARGRQQQLRRRRHAHRRRARHRRQRHAPRPARAEHLVPRPAALPRPARARRPGRRHRLHPARPAAVVVGSNGHVAWGFTNSYGDWMDWRREPACGAATGDTGATARSVCPDVRRHRETIRVAGGAEVSLPVDETDWGPILHRDADGGRWALRWTAHLPGSLSLALGDFAHARSLDDAQRIADHVAIPGQNLMLGDRDGRIAWRLLGPIPQRAAGCSPQPTVAAHAYQGDPDGADCPPWSQATDRAPAIVPASGRAWTANSRVVDGEALRAIGDGGYVLGSRAQQIRDRLFARERFGERDLLAIQLDDRTVFMHRWWQLLRASAARSHSPALAELAGAAPTWQPRATPDSVSYRLVRAWRFKVHERIANGLLAPAQAAMGSDFVMPELPQWEGVVWPLLQQRPGHLLPRAYASWDALLEAAAADVRADLAPRGPLRERTWGERNTARICHPLAAALPGFAQRALCMPFEPLPGDTAMPRVQQADMGASERMVVAPGHEADGITHMPGGQSGHPLSPFWGAGHDDWVHGRATPFLPGSARHVLTLRPAETGATGSPARPQ